MNKKIIYTILIIGFIGGLIFLNVFLNGKNKDMNLDVEVDKNEVKVEESKVQVLQVTSQNFEKEVLQSDKKVLIDFYASWCGPCKIFSPIIQDFARENQDIKVVKIDIDAEQDLAMKYKVMSIPTTIVIEDGKVVNKAVGILDKSQIKEFVKNK